MFKGTILNAVVHKIFKKTVGMEVSLGQHIDRVQDLSTEDLSLLGMDQKISSISVCASTWFTLSDENDAGKSQIVHSDVVRNSNNASSVVEKDDVSRFFIAKSDWS